MIHRSDHSEQFVMITNSIMRDKNLSLSARGLLGYMLTFADEWVFTFEGLVGLTGCTRYEIKMLLKELKTAGYVRAIQSKNSDGRFDSCSYEIYELPQVEIPSSGFTVERKNRRTKNRRTKNRQAEFRPHKNTNIKEDHIKEDHKDKKECALGNFQNVFLSDLEQKALCDRWGSEETGIYIDRLSDYLHDHPGKNYRNHKATIEKWIVEDRQKEA